jgi:hypothetical protein
MEDQNTLQVLYRENETKPINISIGNIGNIEITRVDNNTTRIRIVNYEDIGTEDLNKINMEFFVYDDEFDCSEEE